MKSATIKIYKSLVTAEIDAHTFKRVDGVLSAESDQLKNAVSSDAEEELDATLLIRYIESRDAMLRKKLAFCLNHSEEDDLVVTNEVDQSDALEYQLSVPDSYDKQRLKALAQKIHNYIVQGTLHDWYSEQNLKGNVSADELEEMESAIACMLRSSYVKRPLQPFGPRN